EGNCEQPFALCDAAEFERLPGGGREGFVDDDVLACFKNLLREIEVGFVGCGDDDDFDRFVSEGCFDRPLDFYLRVGLCGGVSAALHDGDEFESGHCADERCMKDAS